MSDLLTVISAIALFANRVAEAIKAALKAHWPTMKPEVVSEIALLSSLGAGILGALVLDVNLLSLLAGNPYLVGVPPIVGVILTGAVASVGSEGLHFFFDLLQAKRDQMTTVTGTTSTSLHIDTQTDTTTQPAAPVVSSPKGGSAPVSNPTPPSARMESTWHAAHMGTPGLPRDPFGDDMWK